jgi:hypothetical protein
MSFSKPVFLANKGQTGPTGMTGPIGYNGVDGTTGPTGFAGTNGVLIQYQYNNNLFNDQLGITGSTERGATGYYVDIQPQSDQSKIRIDYKVKYQTSYFANTNLTLRIKRGDTGGRGPWTTVLEDTVLGSVNAGAPLVNTYTTNYIDYPGTTDWYRYQMFYEINDPSGTLTIDSPMGILGSTGNCLVLEELLGSGTANQGSTGATGPTGSASSVTRPTGQIGSTCSIKYYIT